jgi:hypothetical protein
MAAAAFHDRQLRAFPTSVPHTSRDIAAIAAAATTTTTYTPPQTENGSSIMAKLNTRIFPCGDGWRERIILIVSRSSPNKN